MILLASKTGISPSGDLVSLRGESSRIHPVSLRERKMSNQTLRSYRISCR
jgi:hypothetical protein